MASPANILSWYFFLVAPNHNYRELYHYLEEGKVTVLFETRLVSISKYKELVHVKYLNGCC